MNPEIRRLQILNDLISQTLDIINQRQMAGLAFGAYGPELGIPLNPVQVAPGFGLQHTSPGFIPATNSLYGHQFGIPSVVPTQLGGGAPFVGVAPQYGLSHSSVGALPFQPGFGVTNSYAAPWVAGVAQPRTVMGTPFAATYPLSMW